MLTCPRCRLALYPHLARRTDEGWVHARCPATYCTDCGKRTWRPEGKCRDCELYAPVRQWVRDGLIWRKAS